MDLLTDDWYEEQRRQDIRFYKLLCAVAGKTLEPGALFPSLAKAEVGEEDEADIDPAESFRLTKTALGICSLE